MTIELDHAIVSARNPEASGKFLAGLLGVRCGPAAAGPFYAVYVNDGLTLDFIQTTEPFEIYHFAFRVSDATFDAILGRLREADISYRGAVHGPMDNSIATWNGGR